MRFDDSLETVLAADRSTPLGLASAWRQLVDLIGRRRVAPDSRAMALLESIRDKVPTTIRAGSARALENGQPPAAIVKLLLKDDIAVAAPMLRTARLSSGEWVELLPRLDGAGRSILRTRRDLPPGIDVALEAFGPADFVIAGEAQAVAVEVVAEVVDVATPEVDGVSADVEPSEVAVEALDEEANETRVEEAEDTSEGSLSPVETADAVTSGGAALEAEVIETAEPVDAVAFEMPPSLVADKAEPAFIARPPAPVVSLAPVVAKDAAPMEVSPADEGGLAEQIADEQVTVELTADAQAVDAAPIDWTEVMAARPGTEIDSPTASSPLEVASDDDAADVRPMERARIRLRPVLEPFVAPVAVEAQDAAVDPGEPSAPVALEAAEASDLPVENIDPSAIPLAPSTQFISVGAAALTIPAVAAALKQAAQAGEAQDGAPVVQSETADEPVVATLLATPGEPAHDSGMSGEPIILADRDGAAASDVLHPGDAGIPDAPEGPFEIADVVARIDAFYTRQQDRTAEPVEVPSADTFRFETDEHGVIRWVDGVARAAVVGLSLDLSGTPEGSRVDGVAAGAFRRRAGFSDARLFVSGDGEAAGDWRISANAAFEPATGRFSGYRGSARRPRADQSAAPVPPTPAADSLRELMHELRTPTNAIAGFAELIEREMLGEVPGVYRERAGTIRDQARALLAAIDDLDIAARMEAAALRLQPGEVALRPVLARIAEEMGPLAAMRGAWLALPVENHTVTGDARAIERLLSRLVATLLSAAERDERIEVSMASQSDAQVAIAFAQPRALAAHAGDAVFDIDDEREDVALLGTGFALRLVRNLARELSGSLRVSDGTFTVLLPVAVTKSLEQVR